MEQERLAQQTQQRDAGAGRGQGRSARQSGQRPGTAVTRMQRLSQQAGNQAVTRLLNSDPGPSFQSSGGSGIVASPLMRAHLSGDRCRAAAIVQTGRGPGSLLRPFAEHNLALHNIDTPGVRVHTDDFADRSARDIGARAYAFGQHIFFRHGQFRPETSQGRRLLLHELAHVRQQRAGSDSSDEAMLERRADDMVQSPMLAKPGHMQPASGPSARILRAPNAACTSVVVKPDNTIIFYGNRGPITASIRFRQRLKPGGNYTITYQADENRFLIEPGPDKVFVDVTLTVKGKQDKIDREINLYKAYLASMTSPISLTIENAGAGGGQGSGTGTGAGNAVDADGKSEDAGQPGDGGEPEGKGKDAGAGTQETSEGTGADGDATATDDSTPGAMPPEATSEATPGVPTVQISDPAQIEDLKKRGLIPAQTADQIKSRIENQEPLTFDQAIALLDAMNKVIEPSRKIGAGSGKVSWLEWAKFIEAHKDKISGRTKSGETGMKPEDVKEVIDKYKEFVGLKDPPTTTLKDKLKEKDFDPEVRKSWNSLQDWERKLWTEYQQKYGGSTESDRKDMHITETDKFFMGLRMSPQYMDEGMRDAASQMFNDPIFIGSTLVGITAYLALWALPEPVFSKAIAVTETIALVSMVAFSASELINLGKAWMNLSGETKNATTLEEIEKAAERFGKRVGGTELRIIIALALIVAGKVLPKPTAAPPPSGGGPMLAPAGGPGMGSMAVAEGAVGTVKVVNGVIVIAGPGAGLSAMSIEDSAKGGGGAPEKAPEEAKPAEATGPKEAAGSGTAKYVNKNPKATADETRVGELLNDEASAGRLPGVKEVEGAPEIPGKRSGDYRMVRDDGTQISADLYQPESGNWMSIRTNIIGKSGQAETIVVELGRGQSAKLGSAEAGQIVDDLFSTPGHSIKRLIVIKDGKIILDRQ